MHDHASFLSAPLGDGFVHLLRIEMEHFLAMSGGPDDGALARARTALQANEAAREDEAPDTDD